MTDQDLQLAFFKASVANCDIPTDHAFMADQADDVFLSPRERGQNREDAMREYLTIVQALLKDGRVSHNGEFFKVNAQVQVSVDKAPPVLIAALAPVMLKIAGQMSDGTITWMVGPKISLMRIRSFMACIRPKCVVSR